MKEKTYMSYVCPKLEYCSSIWDPHHQKDIKKLESVQHRAARFVTNTPHRRSGQQISITNKIKELGWQPLQARRQNNRIFLLYKVCNNLVEVPPSYHPTLRTVQPRRGNNRQFQRPHADVDVYHNSFLPRTIRDWNSLDVSTVAADSLESLKQHLDRKSVV